MQPVEQRLGRHGDVGISRIKAPGTAQELETDFTCALSDRVEGQDRTPDQTLADMNIVHPQHRGIGAPADFGGHLGWNETAPGPVLEIGA